MTLYCFTSNALLYNRPVPILLSCPLQHCYHSFRLFTCHNLSKHCYYYYLTNYFLDQLKIRKIQDFTLPLFLLQILTLCRSEFLTYIIFLFQKWLLLKVLLDRSAGDEFPQFWFFWETSFIFLHFWSVIF